MLPHLHPAHLSKALKRQLAQLASHAPEFPAGLELVREGSITENALIRAYCQASGLPILMGRMFFYS